MSSTAKEIVDNFVTRQASCREHVLLQERVGLVHLHISDLHVVVGEVVSSGSEPAAVICNADVACTLALVHYMYCSIVVLLYIGLINARKPCSRCVHPTARCSRTVAYKFCQEVCRTNAEVGTAGGVFTEQRSTYADAASLVVSV